MGYEAERSLEQNAFLGCDNEFLAADANGAPPNQWQFSADPLTFNTCGTALTPSRRSG